MCGRFTLVDLSRFTDLFPWIKGWPEVMPRYNISPTEPILAAICEGSECRMEQLHWGLVPHWASDSAGAARLINARCETAADKPAFRDAMKYRRAIVPATGFYEWQKLEKGKQRFHITRRDGQPMLFAALWDRWHDPGGGELRSCALLTTQSTGAIAGIHDRMPVVLEPAAAERWLKAAPGQLNLPDFFRPPGEERFNLEPQSGAIGPPSLFR